MTEKNDYVNILDTVMRVTNLWRCKTESPSCSELPNFVSQERSEWNGFMFFP